MHSLVERKDTCPGPLSVPTSVWVIEHDPLSILLGSAIGSGGGGLRSDGSRRGLLRSCCGLLLLLLLLLEAGGQVLTEGGVLRSAQNVVDRVVRLARPFLQRLLVTVDGGGVRESARPAWNTVRGAVREVGREQGRPESAG